VEDVRYLGGGIADSFQGTIDGRRYAMKPMERFGSDRFGFGQGNPEGELVCLPLLRELGLVAPEALLFRPGPEAPPVLAMSWVDEELAGGPVELAGDFLTSERVTQADREAFATMFVADALTGNNDRHGGNFFVRTAPDGSVHPVPIDHNLALFPAEIHDQEQGPPELGVQHLDLAAARARGLAADPAWGELVVATARRIHDTLTPAFLDELVEQLPDPIPPERREFLRQLLQRRRARLPEVTEEWAQDWAPSPTLPDDLPELPPGIGWMRRWAPRRVAAVLWYYEGLLEGAPGLAPVIVSALRLPPETDLAGWIAAALPTWATLVEGDREQMREGNRGWGRMLARVYLEGAAVLRSEALAERLGGAVLEQGMRGRIDLTRIFSALYRVNRDLPEKLGVGRLLRATLAMAKTVDGPGLRKQLRQLRPLLERYRHLIHAEADLVRLRLRAQAALLGRFAGLLREALPQATPSQMEEGIFAALRDVPDATLRTVDGRAHPATLARALRATADAAASPIPYAHLGELVTRHGDLATGAWLSGWADPVEADDPRLSLNGLVASGWQPDDAARLLFERLAHGTYGSWRQLTRRLDSPELRSRVLVPGGPPPAPPTLRFPWTGREFGVESRYRPEDSILELLVPVPGLEPIVAARVPIEPTPDGEAWMVADSLPPDFDPAVLEPLDWRPGMRLPEFFWPREERP
jgi:hypothetical protein